MEHSLDLRDHLHTNMIPALNAHGSKQTLCTSSTNRYGQLRFNSICWLRQTRLSLAYVHPQPRSIAPNLVKTDSSSSACHTWSASSENGLYDCTEPPQLTRSSLVLSCAWVLAIAFIWHAFILQEPTNSRSANIMASGAHAAWCSL
jgi:hypothetical protein